MELDKLRRIIAEVLCVDTREITEETSFVDDLCADSLDLYQIVMGIEEEFSINRSTTSEMLKLMTKRGMIQRLPVAKDARLKKIVLTDESRAINQHIDRTLREMHARLTEGLTETEIESFIVVLDKLIANAEK